MYMKEREKTPRATIVLVTRELYKSFDEVVYAGNYLWIASRSNEHYLAGFVNWLQQVYDLPVQLLTGNDDKLFYVGNRGQAEALAKRFDGRCYWGGESAYDTPSMVWVCEIDREPALSLQEMLRNVELAMQE